MYFRHIRVDSAMRTFVYSPILIFSKILKNCLLKFPRKYLGNNVKIFQEERPDLFRINSVEEEFMKIETNIEGNPGTIGTKILKNFIVNLINSPEIS